ncbi:flavin reductase family protein [Novosphingobium sediminicola]|uniref:Flavin reductase (DIM6/NTAB) family NADH-FMN oxidoreductase RutF n=1 Tax=Novosphingobium sediminicola TaxID=563162 RepID=A0A7W6CBT8_9SPHN|nr:flavin reductase family protein [Novosphingobium sediminicola]MBB3953699.1 flavin reductase (DIM6/NTAB) family NADH-FMN oxidoreductase RutF [Novosphingobium sediminicola]
MRFEMDELSAAHRYRLMTSSVTPRPIAWVTTVGKDGLRNAAPFSSFNMMGASPPILALGLQFRADGTAKDTLANIAATGELVVNLVSVADAAAMNETARDFAPQVDELAHCGIDWLPSDAVAPPRIASAPVSFECRTAHLIEMGPDLTIVLARVAVMHVADRLVIDAERGHLDTPAMQLVGRMQGPGWYVRSTDLMQMMPPL